MVRKVTMIRKDHQLALVIDDNIPWIANQLKVMNWTQDTAKDLDQHSNTNCPAHKWDFTEL
jgi:hypothetical protein